MKHSEFKVGEVFYSSQRCQPYIVTDIGSRVIIASIYIGIPDLDENSMQFVFPADELQYCTKEQPKGVDSNYLKSSIAPELREEYDALDELIGE